MKFDIITIGTATRDVFVKSDSFHVDPDHHVLGGKGLVLPLGAKLEIPEIFFFYRRGSHQCGGDVEPAGAYNRLYCRYRQ